jgi:hypothetical protein
MKWAACLVTWCGFWTIARSMQSHLTPVECRQMLMGIGSGYIRNELGCFRNIPKLRCVRNASASQKVRNGMAFGRSGANANLNIGGSIHCS